MLIGRHERITERDKSAFHSWRRPWGYYSDEDAFSDYASCAWMHPVAGEGCMNLSPRVFLAFCPTYRPVPCNVLHSTVGIPMLRLLYLRSGLGLVCAPLHGMRESLPGLETDTSEFVLA